MAIALLRLHLSSLQVLLNVPFRGIVAIRKRSSAVISVDNSSAQHKADDGVKEDTWPEARMSNYYRIPAFPEGRRRDEANLLQS